MTPAPIIASFFVIQRAFVVHDDFLVDRDIRQMPGLGAGRHDDLLGQHFLATNLDLPQVAFLGHEGAMARQQGDLVLLEQALDTGGQLGNDGVLAALHYRHIDARLADLDALGFKAVTGFFKQVRGVKQSLGRNTADVQAGAAEARLALRVGVRIGFGTSGRETQLRGANGRNVTARTTTDNEHVKLLGHVKLRE
jgi:hypothetical protein